MRPDHDAGNSLLVRMASHWCALPIAMVREIMRPLPIEPVRGAPEWVLGVAIIRGVPTPVVDAARLVGELGAAPSRFVILQLGTRRLALATGEVQGVRSISTATLGELPPLLREVGWLAAIGQHDGELLLALQTARLVPETVWSAVATGGTP